MPRLRGLVEGAEVYSGQKGLLTACEKCGIRENVGIQNPRHRRGSKSVYEYARMFGELSEKERKRKGDSPDSNMLSILRCRCPRYA